MSFKLRITTFNQRLEQTAQREISSDSKEYQMMLMNLYESPAMARMSYNRLQDGLMVHHVTRTHQGKLIKVEMERIANEVQR